MDFISYWRHFLRCEWVFRGGRGNCKLIVMSLCNSAQLMQPYKMNYNRRNIFTMKCSGICAVVRSMQLLKYRDWSRLPKNIIVVLTDLQKLCRLLVMTIWSSVSR